MIERALISAIVVGAVLIAAEPLGIGPTFQAIGLELQCALDPDAIECVIRRMR